MNGSGKQSYYEIQLSNGSLIAAFLVAAAVGVTLFVLGVMVGREQGPQALPESGWVEVEPLASGWVIQVKATSDQIEARVLQEQLSRAGFPAFVVQDSRTAMWRVRVGRYSEQADAEKVEVVLSGRTDIKSTWVTQG